MNSALETQGPRERDEVGGSHYENAGGVMRVDEDALTKAKVVERAGEVGTQACLGDPRFKQAGC